MSKSISNLDLKSYADFLLSIAIKKCNNLDDAEDLTQETLLAALVYSAKGNQIVDMKGWLITVLNRKYYDMLRRKYKLPTVTMGSIVLDDTEPDISDLITQKEESEIIRREIAYLSNLYRFLFTRHYFYGESLTEISHETGIPIGTLKSRLSFGRKQIKKGLVSLQSYTENSYMPQRLYMSNSGQSGINDEPMSLVPDDDLIAQNLLILAYEKPISVSDLARAIGIPTAYVEGTIDKLVNGELMRRLNDGKVYTDFIIYDPEDWILYIKEQEKFVHVHGEGFIQPLKQAILQLKRTKFYSERLERFMAIQIADLIVAKAIQQHQKLQELPDRPNGGKWIAFGTRYPENYKIPPEKQGQEEYGYSGQRITVIDEYLGVRNLMMLNYETSLYPMQKHDGFGYYSFSELEQDMLRLFYQIRGNISPETVGFHSRIITDIPLLVEKGMITLEQGKPKLLVPHLTYAQYQEYLEICDAAVKNGVSSLSQSLSEFIKTRKKQVPPHLDSVPEQKLTWPYQPNAMMFVYEAIKQGVMKRDLGYICPETIVVFS